MLVFKGACCMGNIKRDIDQLDVWPIQWRCKECGERTRLLVTDIIYARILDERFRLRGVIY